MNLEKALSGHPVILRNGNKAFIRHVERDLIEEGQLLGYIIDDCGVTAETWRINGRYAYYTEASEAKSGSDIIGMYPPTSRSGVHTMTITEYAKAK